MVADDAANQQALRDIYDLRNAVEHLNPLVDEPSRIAKPKARAELRNQLVRQVEDLSLRIYKRLFSDRHLMHEFSTDTGINALWALPRPARRLKWSDSIDLTTIP